MHPNPLVFACLLTIILFPLTLSHDCCCESFFRAYLYKFTTFLLLFELINFDFIIGQFHPIFNMIIFCLKSNLSDRVSSLSQSIMYWQIPLNTITEKKTASCFSHKILSFVTFIFLFVCLSHFSLFFYCILPFVEPFIFLFFISLSPGTPAPSGTHLRKYSSAGFHPAHFSDTLHSPSILRTRLRTPVI